MATNRIIAEQLEELSDNNELEFSAPAHLNPAEAWKQLFPNTTPNNFYAKIERAAGDENVAVSVIEEDGEAQIILHHGGGNSAQKNHLTFSISEDKAEIISASLQNTGIHTAKGYLRAMANILMKNDIDALTLNTTSIGGYAWAKYGFKPASEKEWGNLKADIKKHIKNDHVCFKNKEYKLEESELKIINAVLAKESPPEAIWELTETLNRKLDTINGHDITVGKALLIDRTWKGILPLNERNKGFQRFQAYTAPNRAIEIAGAHR